MPASKTLRAQRRKTLRNRSVKSHMRSRLNAARKSIADAPAASDTEEKVRAAVSALDVAVRKGIIHRNQSARKKSRLAKKLNNARSA